MADYPAVNFIILNAHYAYLLISCESIQTDIRALEHLALKMQSFDSYPVFLLNATFA